ncbi:MAG: hypothetical protein M1609_09510 [Firmicutes bacterium]|nr:hypothetical protein [Bacillota bacterium]
MSWFSNVVSRAKKGVSNFINKPAPAPVSEYDYRNALTPDNPLKAATPSAEAWKPAAKVPTNPVLANLKQAAAKQAAPAPSPRYTPSDMVRYSNSSLNNRPGLPTNPVLANLKQAAAKQAASKPTSYGGTSGQGRGWITVGSMPSYIPGGEIRPSPTGLNAMKSYIYNLGVKWSRPDIYPTFRQDVGVPALAAGVLGGGALAAGGLAGAGNALTAAGSGAVAATQRGVNTAQQAANRLGPAASNKLINIGNTAKNVSQTSAGQLGIPLGVSSLLPTTSSVTPKTQGQPEVNQPTLNVDPSTNQSLGVGAGNNFMGGNSQVNTSMSGMGGGIVPGPGMTQMTPSGFPPGGIVPGPGMTQSSPEQPPEQPLEQPPEQPRVEQMQVPENLFNPVQMRQEMDQLFSGINTQNATLMAKLSEQLLGQLDTLESDLKKQYEQQGSVIDPATQAALKEMRAEVDRRRQGLMEEMNRRGLLQSGIWLEEENRILGNQLTSEEKLLAGRVADIQNRMTDAMLKLGTQRTNTMGTLAQNQMQNQQWIQGQQINAMNTLNTRNDQWNQWWQGQINQQKQDAENKRRWEYEQGQAKAKAMAGWSGTIPEGYPGAGQPTWEATTKARQMDIDAQKTQAGQYSDSATNRYVQLIPTYSSLDKALADFQKYRSVMEGEKADTQRILNTIYAYFGG